MRLEEIDVATLQRLIDIAWKVEDGQVLTDEAAH
jgi:hypothetical protein